MNCRTDVIYEVFPTKEKPWPCKQTNAHTTKVRIAPANLEIPGHITQCSNCSLDCKKCVISGVRAQSLHAIVSPILPSLLITWKKKLLCAQYFCIVSWFAPLAVHVWLLSVTHFTDLTWSDRVAQKVRWAFLPIRGLRGELFSGIAIAFFMVSFSPMIFSLLSCSLGFQCRARRETHQAVNQHGGKVWSGRIGLMNTHSRDRLTL